MTMNCKRPPTAFASASARLAYFANMSRMVCVDYTSHQQCPCQRVNNEATETFDGCKTYKKIHNGLRERYHDYVSYQIRAAIATWRLGAQKGHSRAHWRSRMVRQSAQPRLREWCGPLGTASDCGTPGYLAGVQGLLCGGNQSARDTFTLNIKCGTTMPTLGNQTRTFMQWIVISLLRGTRQEEFHGRTLKRMTAKERPTLMAMPSSTPANSTARNAIIHTSQSILLTCKQSCDQDTACEKCVHMTNSDGFVTRIVLSAITRVTIHKDISRWRGRA